MLPRALRKNTPQSIFIASLYAAPIIVLALLDNRHNYTWPEYNLLSNFFNAIIEIGWLTKLLSGGLLIGSAIYGQLVFYKYRLFDQGNQFPFVLIIALVSCSSQTFALSPLWVSLPFLVRLLDRSFEIQRSDKVHLIIMEASFTAGILFLISSDFLWLYPIILIAYLYSGNLQLRGFLISLFGFVLPYYFMFSINYLIGESAAPEVHSELPHYFLPSSVFEVILIGGCLLVITIGFSYLLKAIMVNKVIIKNHLLLLIVFSVLLIASLSISAKSYGDALAGTFPAFSVLAGLYFLKASKVWLMEVTYILWYASVILYLSVSLN